MDSWGLEGQHAVRATPAGGCKTPCDAACSKPVRVSRAPPELSRAREALARLRSLHGQPRARPWRHGRRPPRAPDRPRPLGRAEGAAPRGTRRVGRPALPARGAPGRLALAPEHRHRPGLLRGRRGRLHRDGVRPARFPAAVCGRAHVRPGRRRARGRPGRADLRRAGRDRPPRPQARERDGDRRRPREARRLRHREGDRRRVAADRDRHDPRHAALHGARTGDGPARRPGDRPLRRRLRGLRARHRPAPLRRRRQRPDDRAPAPHQRGRAAGLRGLGLRRCALVRLDLRPDGQGRVLAAALGRRGVGDARGARPLDRRPALAPRLGPPGPLHRRHPRPLHAAPVDRGPVGPGLRDLPRLAAARAARRRARRARPRPPLRRRAASAESPPSSPAAEARHRRAATASRGAAARRRPPSSALTRRAVRACRAGRHRVTAAARPVLRCSPAGSRSRASASCSSRAAARRPRRRRPRGSRMPPWPRSRRSTPGRCG